MNKEFMNKKENPEMRASETNVFKVLTIYLFVNLCILILSYR